MLEVVPVGVLRTRLAEPWTPGALAGEVHLSRFQLVRCFDVTFGRWGIAALGSNAEPAVIQRFCWSEPVRSVGLTV
jgi:hypothetical protein